MAPTRLIEGIQARVNALDPCALLKMGAPADEYMPEVEEMAEEITWEETLSAEKVRDIFLWQGLDISKETATKIQTAIQDFYDSYDWKGHISDISKCSHPTCPSRNTCWRQLCPPSPYAQSYAAYQPVGEKCDSYREATPAEQAKYGKLISRGNE